MFYKYFYILLPLKPKGKSHHQYVSKFIQFFLQNSKRKSVRSVLYVSGDGLRVVDDDTRGLILDQTIEKVSRIYFNLTIS